MRVFPRINYRRMGAKGGHRRRVPGRARTGPLTPLLAVPPLLLAASLLAYAYAGPGALLLLASAAAALATAQGFALRRLSGRRPLHLSAQDGEDRRFLLDLSGGVRAAANVGQLYEQVAGKIAREFGVGSVSLFIRDEASGDFVCRVTYGRLAGAPPTDAQASRLGGGDFVIRRLRHLASPLAVGSGSFDLWVQTAPAQAREARAREAEVLRRLDARLLVQVNARDRLTGVLALGPRASGRAYTAEEKLLLLSVAGQLALVIENSRLLERIVEEERLRRELLMAAEVQQRLFPERPPPPGAVELAGYCQPARKVGGDYYDFFDFGGGQTGLVVADVAGKGISAALLMSTLQASLRARVADGHPDAAEDGALGELVSTLNRLLCQSTGPASYVTFFYAQFDELTSVLSYVNAGHNPPLLLCHAGESPAAVAGSPTQGAAREVCAGQQFDRGGPVLGIFEGCRYEQGAVPMQSGQLFVGYTDGVVEALSGRGEEFGESRLRDCVASSAHMTAEEICARVVGRVDEWCAGTPQHDDLTLVILKVR